MLGFPTAFHTNHLDSVFSEKGRDIQNQERPFCSSSSCGHKSRHAVYLRWASETHPGAVATGMAKSQAEK